MGGSARVCGCGRAVLFQRDYTSTAVRASSEVSAVFVTLDFARHMGAGGVLAVDISAPRGGNDAEGTLQILLQTFAIMGKTINQYERSADVGVRPPSQGLKTANFSARGRAMDSGWAAMMAGLRSLRVCLEAKALAA